MPKNIPKTAAQSFRNGEIHDWYRIVLGYSDHLVADLIAKLGLKPGHRVLDPFSGAGTTAVECKKNGIDCWAVDANPSSWFAAKVKTTWNLPRGSVLVYGFLVADFYLEMRANVARLTQDITFRYFEEFGLIDRGWISRRRLLDVIAVKRAIAHVKPPPRARDALDLALTYVLVNQASNVRFGPELYCGAIRPGVNVISEFLARVVQMDADLESARTLVSSKTKIVLGDSRTISRAKLGVPSTGFDAVITSPPYPTEHDYTRNSRLELALLEHVVDRTSLQKIKKGMVRSHTKGIYVGDSVGSEVSRIRRITLLIQKIERKAAKKRYGFARLYGKVTREYFGGMRLHFRAIRPLMKPGALCAYVVGDQASYFRVKISTASILGDIAEAEGFKVQSVRVWRRRWASATKQFMKEHILLIRKPGKSGRKRGQKHRT